MVEDYVAENINITNSVRRGKKKGGGQLKYSRKFKLS